MFQVCQAILRNPYDSTKIFLVYANRAEEDILLHEKLDEWARKERARFKVQGLAAMTVLLTGEQHEYVCSA